MRVQGFRFKLWVPNGSKADLLEEFGIRRYGVLRPQQRVQPSLRLRAELWGGCVFDFFPSLNAV